MVARGRNIVICPDCGEEIFLKGRIELGREVICPNCDAELKVVETKPLALDWSYDDYDDYYDEEEEQNW